MQGYGAIRRILPPNAPEGQEGPEMLETVDLSLSLSKVEFKQVMEPLGWRMADMQRQCRTEGVPVIIVMEGWDAAGKGGAIGRLAAVLDPRGFLVHLIAKPTEDETLRPFLARYWSRLPARGQIAIFDHSWYRRVLDDRVDSNVPDDVWREAYDEIDAFESQLAADGYCIVKFWMHISKDEQKKRFDKLRSDPAFAWRVGKDELAASSGTSTLRRSRRCSRAPAPARRPGPSSSRCAGGTRR
jgi:polyphosphate kinase 2 (PPK2 family)